MSDSSGVDFDPNVFYLGTLCKHGHDWQTTGKSLRRIATKGCRECCLANTRKWKARHRDAVSEYNSEYYARTIEYQSERHKRYRKENSEKIKKRDRFHRERRREQRLKNWQDWYTKNKDRVSKYRKEYYAANQDSIRANARNYGKQNREARREYDRKRYRTPEGYLRIKAKHNRRRARKKQNHSAPYSPQDLLSRSEIFGGRCAYCGSDGKLSWDHFIPISRGGCDALGNLIPACSSCNNSKLDADPFEWYSKQSFYSKKQWKLILKVLGKTQNSYQQIPFL